MIRIKNRAGIGKAVMAFIIINLVLTVAGLGGIFIMNSLKAAAADLNILNACNWYIKLLIGLTSLTFDLAALAWFFSTRKDDDPGDDASESDPLRWVMRHRQA